MKIALLLIVLLAFIIIGTARFKIHPFFTLLISAVSMGLFLGMGAENTLGTVMDGFGKTLSGIGIIIALGATIGAFLEKSGATSVLAKSLLKMVGLDKSLLAMNLTGFVVSIPVFCDSGFIILSSLNKALSKKSGIKLTAFAISLAAGLYATHVFVPPTPGPLAAAIALDADLGWVILFGVVVALPVSLSGFLWARWIGKREQDQEHRQEQKRVQEQEQEQVHGQEPGIVAAVLPILIPILLIAIKSVAEYPTNPIGGGSLQAFFTFVGNPIIALSVGAGLSLFLVIKQSRDEIYGWVSDAIKEAGAIILITGAGGAFGAVIRASEFGSILENQTAFISLGIFMAFILSAILKSAQGSSTVAIITTAAIIAPLLGTFGLTDEIPKALTVLAIGAGAMTVSHVNDSFFWVVSQFSGMSTKTALRTQTVSTFIQGVVGITLIWVLSLLF